MGSCSAKWRLYFGCMREDWCLEDSRWTASPGTLIWEMNICIMESLCTGWTEGMFAKWAKGIWQEPLAISPWSHVLGFEGKKKVYLRAYVIALHKVYESTSIVWMLTLPLVDVFLSWNNPTWPHGRTMSSCLAHISFSEGNFTLIVAKTHINMKHTHIRDTILFFEYYMPLDTLLSTLYGLPTQ